MLSVVPHWIRLLLWPAHLQGDYSPAEIVTQTSWGSAQTLGLLILLGLGGVMIAAWRRAPAIALGLVWCAVAIFPVHNVLVPTGIVLADRTLFLPSVGAMIVLGGVGALLLKHSRPREQLGLGVITGMLIILGVYRSALRHPNWSDQFNYWYRTARYDAPLSYRAHHALAQVLVLAKLDGQAEREFRLAIAYAPPGVSSGYLEYADKLRLRGFCVPAVPLYRKAVEIAPNNLAARASLTSCLIYLGRYQEALTQTRFGLASGAEVRTWRWLRDTADSALRALAPPGSVRLKQLSDSAAADLRIGMTP